MKITLRIEGDGQAVQVESEIDTTGLFNNEVLALVQADLAEMFDHVTRGWPQ